MKKIYSVISVVFLLFALTLNALAVQAPTCSFGSKDTFTILQISDPQDDAYPAHGLNEFLSKAIQTAKPDLIILSGDIAEDSRFGDLVSDAQPFHEGVLVKGDYEKTFANVKAICDTVFEPFERSGIPYAIAMGDNDYRTQLKNEDWLKIFAEYPHCLTVDMSDDTDGHIDTYISLEADGRPVCGLFALDNARGFTDGQLEWLKNYPTQGVPCYAFEHNPIAETGNLFEECSLFDDGAILTSGKVVRLNHAVASGHTEDPCLPGNTSAQFPVLKQKNTVAAFFGDIHLDGYTGVYDGMTLGVTYGCQFAKPSPYGIRTVTICKDDPSQVNTTLYTYRNGVFTQQTDSEDYRTADSPLEKVVFSVVNLFAALIRSFIYVLKF